MHLFLALLLLAVPAPTASPGHMMMHHAMGHHMAMHHAMGRHMTMTHNPKSGHMMGHHMMKAPDHMMKAPEPTPTP